MIHLFSTVMWYFVQILFLIINYCYSEYYRGTIVSIQTYRYYLNAGRDVLQILCIYHTVDIIKPKIDTSQRTQRRIIKLHSQIQMLERKVQELTSKIEIKTRKAVLYKELYSKSLSNRNFLYYYSV